MKFIFPLVAILIFCSTGCGPGEPAEPASSTENAAEDHDHDHEHDDEHDHDHADHDGHDHGSSEAPQSFDEAVAYIEKSGGAITEAFASGEPESAHDELHDIGHVIESLPELAKQAGLTDEQLDAVETATESLLDAFGELDGTLHGGEAVEVADLSQQISAQVDSLRALL
jgi:hypothetical protein